MKIIHTADIHLDSKLTTHLSNNKLITRRNEVLQAFKKMVDYATKNSVSAIVIAGDFFDSSEVSLKTKNFVFDLMKENSQIGFYYVCGNHDESVNALSGCELPQNLHLFSTSVSTYELDSNITISGIELNNANRDSFYSSISLPQNKFNLFILHGQINSKDDERIDLKKLENKNISYLALGHIHSYSTGKLPPNGAYAYSGCLEGTGFDDVESKGFVVIDIDQSSFKTSFVTNSIRVMKIINVDISNTPTALLQEKAVETAIKDIDPQNLVRVNLTGNIEEGTVVDVNYLQSSFSNRFFYVEFENNTKLIIDPYTYKNDVSLKGEFASLVLNDASLTQDTKYKILQLGINTILGREVE